GEGGVRVRADFRDQFVVRPAVMFGQDDAFLTAILELLRRLPIYPMFGRGLTRLQPAYVEDVAGAIVSALRGTQRRAITFECGGPRIYSYEEFLRVVAHEAGLERILVPIPLAAWHALAWIAEVLPTPPITRNQVELMRTATVGPAECPALKNLQFRRLRWKTYSSRCYEVARAACRPRSRGENLLRDLGMDTQPQIALYARGRR